MRFFSRFSQLFSAPSEAPEPANLPALSVKNDAWVSATQGIGTTRDKTFDAFYATDFTVDDIQLEGLFYGSDLAAKIVNKVVSDALAKGVQCAHKDDPQTADELEESAKKLNVLQVVKEACSWARIYGGALIIVGYNDGLSLEAPVDFKRVKNINWLLSIDRRGAQAAKYINELGPNFGMPEIYTITSQSGGVSYTANVHHTRVIHIDGAPVDRRKRASCRGFGLSVLQRPYDVLRSFGLSFSSASLMLSDATQGVFKLKGLINAVASGESEAILDRMRLLDQGRSVSRSIALDSDTEDFQKIATSFSGVPELLDRLMMRLASSADMPVSILMGRSAAGMNATGDLDLAVWEQSVKAFQQDVLAPIFDRIFKDLYVIQTKKDSDEISVQFAPLGEESATTKAAIYTQFANADNVYIAAGVLDPAEVAIARFGGKEFSLESPKVDIEALQKELATRNALPTFNNPLDVEDSSESATKGEEEAAK